MPITKIDYVDMPFASPRVTPNRGALAALYVRQGENLAELALRKGENKARTFERLGQIYNGYTEQVRQQKAAEAALALRAQEREQDRAETEKDRQMRRDEAKEARRVASERETREAARIMVNDLEPGPQSPVVAELARRYPELAARFSSRETLPATVTPGAAGMVSPDQGTYDVLEPSKDDLERSRAQLYRESQAAAALAARKVDDARMDAAQRQNVDYQNKSLAIQQQNANTSLMNAQTTQRRYTGGGVDTAKLGPLANVLDRAILTITPSKRGPILALAHRLADEGNDKALREVIQQAAIENEPVATKDAIRARRATVAALDDAMTVITEMKKAGVPSGFLSGTAEDVARKLGTSTDPRYVAFATQLQDTLINYRRAATGAAFGEREGADYARMFPNYLQTFPVNEATINGLKRSMATSEREYWRGKLGEDGAALVLDPPSAAGGGRMVEAIDPQGNVHHAPAGTPLPKGWKLK